jgi:hypothetical protein
MQIRERSLPQKPETMEGNEWEEVRMGALKAGSAQVPGSTDAVRDFVRTA